MLQVLLLSLLCAAVGFIPALIGIIFGIKQKKSDITKRIYFDPSYLNKKDALRTVRRAYPTVYIGGSKFDVDDDYNPYFVYEYRENFFYSNGDDYGLIILNMQDGTINKYTASFGDIPDWIDFETTYPR